MSTRTAVIVLALCFICGPAVAGRIARLARGLRQRPRRPLRARRRYSDLVVDGPAVFSIWTVRQGDRVLYQTTWEDSGQPVVVDAGAAS